MYPVEIAIAKDNDHLY